MNANALPIKNVVMVSLGAKMDFRVFRYVGCVTDRITAEIILMNPTAQQSFAKTMILNAVKTASAYLANGFAIIIGIARTDRMKRIAHLKLN